MKKYFKKFVVGLFTMIIANVMFMSYVFAEPLLSTKFLDACKNNDLDTVKKIINDKEGSGQDLNVSNDEFASPLAAAAHFNAKDIVSYLICHPKIDINKKMVEFDLAYLGEYALQVPLFFGLLYQNDDVNLKLLLDNPKFKIDSLKKGLHNLNSVWDDGKWKLDPKTKKVLEASKYYKFFIEFLNKLEDTSFYSYKPYFYGYKINSQLDSFSDTSSDSFYGSFSD